MLVNWKIGPNMPFAMSVYIQSVLVGDTLYVGGGSTEDGDNDYVVLAYHTKSSLWTALTPYSTRWFGMTVTTTSQLVLVGGRFRDLSSSSDLGVWDSEGQRWTHPFPAMPTPRWHPSATFYGNSVVVAGGSQGSGCLASVEILDIYTKQWSVAESTPTPWACMKSVVIENTWYLTGGWYGSSCVPHVYSVSLETLVSNSTSERSKSWIKISLKQKAWKQLSSLSSTQSCPMNFGGFLFAIGGVDIKKKKPVSAVRCFVPVTNSWATSGRLSHSVYDCAAVQTSDKIFVFGGGNDGQMFCTVQFISIS